MTPFSMRYAFTDPPGRTASRTSVFADCRLQTASGSLECRMNDRSNSGCAPSRFSCLAELLRTPRGQVRNPVVLDVGPRSVNGIQLRGIGRERFQLDRRVRGQVFRHDGTGMDDDLVPDDCYRPAGRSAELSQEE